MTKGKATQVSRGVGYSFLSLLLVLGLFSALNIYYAKKDWKLMKADNSYQELLSEIAVSVERNTPAIGRGVDFIYASLGWDTSLHLSDDLGLTQNLIQTVKDTIIESNTKLFLEIGSLRRFANAYWDRDMDEVILNSYIVHNKFYINDIEYWYVEPKDLVE